MFKATLVVFFAVAFDLCLQQSDAKATGSARKPTTIGDLPVELLLTIYDGFNLAELNAVAELHPFHRSVAETAFKQKFGKKLLLLDRGGLTIKHDGRNGITENFGEIHTMYETIELFGHLITKLSIDYGGLSTFESILINERLTKHLGNSLVEIVLNQFDDEKLKGLEGPFNKVETLRCRWGKVKSNAINLSQVFPVVSTIDLDKLRFNPATIELHFPHLQALIVDSWDDATANLLRILQSNAQLRNLTIPDAGFNYLRDLSKIVPQLERLALNQLFGGSTIQGEDIPFEHLKTFIVASTINFEDGSNQLPNVFGRLEEIYIYNLGPKMFELAKQNKNLKRVTFHNLNSRQLQKVAEEFSDLEMFRTSFRVESAEAVDQIVRFIETAKSLKEINLWNCSPEYHGKVHEIQEKWKMIKGEYRDHVTFVQRQPEDYEI